MKRKYREPRRYQYGDWMKGSVIAGLIILALLLLLKWLGVVELN